MTVRIIIADDHSIVGESLKQFLTFAGGLSILGVATSDIQLMSLLRQHEVDLLLTDLSMPGVSGMDLLEKVHRQFPLLPILVLSMHNEGPIVARALKAGASGYVTKDSDPEVLLNAIRIVAARGRFLDPSLVDKVVFDLKQDVDDPVQSLSGRELEVLVQFARGSGLNEIALRLSVSPKTISTHKMRLMQKLNISSNAELIRFAMKQGLIPG